MISNVAIDENKNNVQMTTFIRFRDEFDDNFGDEVSPTPLTITQQDSVELAVCVDNVNLTYGKGKSAVYGLNGISLHVKMGTIYGLLGPSGCGKTSLLRCILGCLTPESGTVRVFGFKPGARGSDIPGPGVGYMPQDIALHEDLQINEMLIYFGKLAGMERVDIKQMATYLMSVLKIPDRYQIVGTLSGGQKRRVSFACALIHKPKLLILDEPTVGVDPILREKIWDMLIECTENMNMSVIITTHYIEETKRSNTVGFMRRGKLLAEDTPEHMLTRFRCETLEEVFYKLCVRQKRASIAGEKMLHRQISAISLGRRQSIHNISWQKSVMPKFKWKLNFNGQEWLSILFTVLWKVTIQSVRQRGALLLQAILPVFSLVIFGLCVGDIPKDVTLAVVNDESPPYLSEIYLRNIDSRILHTVNYTNLSSAIEAVNRTKAWAVLHINENFSESLIQRFENIDDYEDTLIASGQMKVYADLTNRVLSITLQRALEEALKPFIVDALKELGYDPQLLEVPIKVDEVIYGKLVRSNFFELNGFTIPGLMVILTYTFGFAGTLLLAMTEKYDKIYDRNKVAGVTTTHIITAHLISRFMFMTLTSVALLIIALYGFDMPAHGSLFWAVVLLFLQIIAGLTMGMMISTMCTSFYMSVILSNGVLLFIFIISGVLWSIEALPYWLRWVSLMSPTTMPTQSLRSILTRGMSITNFIVLKGFLISIAYIIIFFVISVIFFDN